jgi:hypothetical protein
VKTGDIEIQYCLQDQTVGGCFTMALQGKNFFFYQKSIIRENATWLFQGVCWHLSGHSVRFACEKDMENPSIWYWGEKMCFSKQDLVC